MSYFIELEEHEDGDLFLTLPEEVIETLGWETGMLLTWDVKGDGIVVQRVNSETGYEQLE